MNYLYARTVEKNNEARVKQQAELIWPNTGQFIAPEVLCNTLYNPFKLDVVYAIANYWDRVAHRSVFSFWTTDVDTRAEVTGAIRHAINLPNAEFLAVIKEQATQLHRRRVHGEFVNMLDGLVTLYENPDNHPNIFWKGMFQFGVVHALSYVISALTHVVNEPLGSVSDKALSGLMLIGFGKLLYDCLAVTPENQPLQRPSH